MHPQDAFGMRGRLSDACDRDCRRTTSRPMPNGLPPRRWTWLELLGCLLVWLLAIAIPAVLVRQCYLVTR